MFLINVKFIAGALTGPQKRELAARVAQAVAASAGADMGRATWCLLEELPEGAWSVDGEAIALDDVRALAREPEPQEGLG